MYCNSCGTQLPNDANYCSNCGLPQKAGIPGIAPSTSEPKWETCEIHVGARTVTNLIASLNPFSHPTDSMVSFFYAEAIGPTGVYTAATTAEVPYKNRNVVFEGLVAQLLKEGWENDGKGEKWFAYRFKRRVKQST